MERERERERERQTERERERLRETETDRQADIQRGEREVGDWERSMNSLGCVEKNLLN